MSDHYGLKLVIIRATGEFQNVHGIPEDIVVSMRVKFKDIPNETQYKEIA